MKKIAIFVPAWNEEDGIAATIESIRDQSLEGVEIAATIVVANNCTDATVEVARQYVERRYRPVTVLDVPVCPGKKAGAMNIAWRWLVENGTTVDFVFTMDAETVMAQGALQALVDEHIADSHLGAVCARYMPKSRKGLVRRLQALEYARFDDLRELRDWKVQVASGAAVMYKQDVLEQVVSATGRSGPWDETSLIEDYGLTLDVKTLGYVVRAARYAMVLTDTPASWRELWKQRTRWGRGGVDECRKHGWSSATRRDIMGYGVFAVNLVMRLYFVAWLALLITLGSLPTYSLIGCLPQALMWYNRIASTRTLRDKTWKDRTLVYTVLAEDAYGFFMEAVTTVSLWRSYRGRLQTW